MDFTQTVDPSQAHFRIALDDTSRSRSCRTAIANYVRPTC